MSVDEKQLDQLKQTLQADDYRMRRRRPGRLRRRRDRRRPERLRGVPRAQAADAVDARPRTGRRSGEHPAGLPDRLPRRPGDLLSVEVSLEGKVALVTGVGPNIGSGVALALARYGAKVACNDVDRGRHQGLPSPGSSATVARRWRRPATSPTRPRCRATSTRVLEKWGRIDILVNNAAILGGKGRARRDRRGLRAGGAGRRRSATSSTPSTSDGRWRERGIRGSIVCIRRPTAGTARPA